MIIAHFFVKVKSASFILANFSQHFCLLQRILDFLKQQQKMYKLDSMHLVHSLFDYFANKSVMLTILLPIIESFLCLRFRYSRMLSDTLFKQPTWFRCKQLSMGACSGINYEHACSKSTGKPKIYW